MAQEREVCLLADFVLVDWQLLPLCSCGIRLKVVLSPG